MDFAPWATNASGEYRDPAKKEIDAVYGISGSAIAETLVYFEACGGDTERLVELLNSHAIDQSYKITRRELLDSKRWYSNEYYFYFIIFTKKIIGRYDFHFSEDNNEQLSIYHKKFELGYLQYIPYGSGDEDITNAIPYTIYHCMINKHLRFSDMLEWADILCMEKGVPGYKENIFPLRDIRINSDFMGFLFNFMKILSNCNDQLALINECITVFHYDFFIFVPYWLFPTAIERMVNFSTDVYDISVSSANNKLVVDLEWKKTYQTEKFSHYRKEIQDNANNIVLSGCLLGLKTSLRMKDFPEYKLLSPIDCEKVLIEFPIRRNHLWRRIGFGFASFLAIPVIAFFLKDTGYSMPIVIIIAALSLCVQNQFLSYYRNRNRHTDFLIAQNKSNVEDKEKSITELRNLSDELMSEKKNLEEKVRSRTTEIEWANQKLRDYDKSKTDFFYNVSHELRTPLTLIKAPLMAIKNGKYGEISEDQKPVLDMALRNVDRLHEQVDMLLEFAKIDQKRISVEPQPVNLYDLCSFYVSELMPRAESLGITLSLDSRMPLDQPAIVSIDIKLFERVFFNIALNALKFTPRGGNVLISLLTQGKDIELSFSDTGIGIPKDKIDFIFERFAQLDASSTRKYEGTGIGLALVKEICAILGATIRVESEIGKGSVFTVGLKRMECESIDISKAFSATVGISKNPESFAIDEKSSNETFRNEMPTILLVEDTEDMRHFLKDLLSESYRVLEAANGIEALELWHEHPGIDLVITDIMMPLMDGRELYRIISNEDNRCVPFLFLTARASSEEKIEAMREGAIDYIFKPFMVEEILAKTSSLLSLMNGKSFQIKKEIEGRIREVIQGKPSVSIRQRSIDSFGFSAREREVAIMVIEGKRNKEIAAVLGISEHTVSHHVESIFRKSGMGNRLEFINLVK